MARYDVAGLASTTSGNPISTFSNFEIGILRRWWGAFFCSPRVCNKKPLNWVVVFDMFFFIPCLGKIPILTFIFFRWGWNHQPEKILDLFFWRFFFTVYCDTSPLIIPPVGSICFKLLCFPSILSKSKRLTYTLKIDDWEWVPFFKGRMRPFSEGGVCVCFMRKHVSSLFWTGRMGRVLGIKIILCVYPTTGNETRSWTKSIIFVQIGNIVSGRFNYVTMLIY